MSASTPTIQGGYRNLQLGGALVAIALAIVVVAALVAVQATASRGRAQAAPQAGRALTAPHPGRAGSFDRTYAVRSGPLNRSPYAVQGDHGWATDGRIAAPAFIELPRPFDPTTLSAPAAPVLLELPRPFDPSTLGTPANGGRGTRFAN